MLAWEWDEARNNFNKALQIKIEFNDRYSQASTYYLLAKISEATGDLDDAKSGYMKDLEIMIEFNDDHGLDISMNNLARFYRAHSDDAFLSEVANLLGIETTALKQQLGITTILQS